MTDASKTYIAYVLDSSGSMSACKEATEEGFNAFIDEQKKVPGECLMTLVRFNTSTYLDYTDKPIAEVEPLTLRPAGGTALLDAIGMAINETGAKLSAKPEDQRPGAVIVVIQTDGAENSSTRFNLRQIHDMITHQTEAYQWNFVFLGANQDAIQAGTTMGVAAHSSLTYGTAHSGAAMRSASANVASYRGMVASGAPASVAMASTGFTDTDRAEAMGESTTSTTITTDDEDENPTT